MTPFCSASFAIATPVGPSSGHTIRTLAPRLMSAVASLNWVASWPCALSMRNSDEVYPASVKASFMYGASKSTHRVDDVVSGRITPICRLLAPLVADVASGLNWDIVDAMSTVNELMLSPEGTVDELVVAGLDVGALAEVAEAAGVDDAGAGVDDDDEQPAATMAVTAATTTRPNLGRDLFVPWPSDRECHPPCPLLRRSIPDPFRHNALRYDDVGHRTTRVSFRDER